MLATVILRCTGKVLRLLREPTPLAGTPSDEDWYAHLLWVDGRKCLLFTHAGTLFSVFVPDVIVRDLRPIGPFVVSAIATGLRGEGLPAHALGEHDPEEVTVAKTADRRILGTINDLAFTAGHIIAGAGGLAHCDVEALNHRLHRTINSITGYSQPIDLVTARSIVKRRRSGNSTRMH